MILQKCTEHSLLRELEHRSRADWINGSVHVSAFDADFSADSGIAGYPTEGYATVTAFNFTNKSTGSILFTEPVPLPSE
jgi:hypothetical protein